MARLLFAFVFFALAELGVLLALGQALGFFRTLAVLLVSSLVGTVVARRMGARVLARWAQAVNDGALPDDGVLGGVLVLAGGALLIVPGVLSDVLAISLLIPGTRALWARGVRGWLDRGVASGRVTTRTVSMSGHAASDGSRRTPRPRAGGVIDVTGHELSRSEAQPSRLEPGDD